MKSTLFISVFFVLASTIFAQGGPPTPPDPANGAVPIDAGVLILVFAGILLGSVAYFKNKPQRTVN